MTSQMSDFVLQELDETLQSLWALVDQEIVEAREVREAMSDRFRDMREISVQTGTNPVEVLEHDDLMLVAHSHDAAARDRIVETLEYIPGDRIVIPVPFMLDRSVPTYWSLLEIDLTDPDFPEATQHYPHSDAVSMERVLAAAAQTLTPLEDIIHEKRPDLMAGDFNLRHARIEDDPWGHLPGRRPRPLDGDAQPSPQQIVLDLAETIMNPVGMQIHLEDTDNIQPLNMPLGPARPWPAIPLADTEPLSDVHVDAGLNLLSQILSAEYPEVIRHFRIGTTQLSRHLMSDDETISQSAYDRVRQGDPEFIFLPIADTALSNDYHDTQWSFVMLQRDRDVEDEQVVLYRAFHYDSSDQHDEQRTRVAESATALFVDEDDIDIADGEMGPHAEPYQSGDYMLLGIRHLVRAIAQSTRRPDPARDDMLLDVFFQEAPSRAALQYALGNEPEDPEAEAELAQIAEDQSDSVSSEAPAAKRPRLER